jgi:hypothetical protein
LTKLLLEVELVVPGELAAALALVLAAFVSALLAAGVSEFKIVGIV